MRRCRPSGRGSGQRGQAPKGVWGMSWRQEATKGAEDCDKPGRAVNQALTPGSPNARHSIHRCRGRTGGTETSQYPQEEKATATPSVAASERGPAQTIRTRPGGVVGPSSLQWGGVTKVPSSGTAWNGGPQRVTAPYAAEVSPPARSLSRAGHVKPGSNPRGPSRKAKYSLATDSEPSSASERWEEPRPGEDSEPETTRLQAVGGLCPPAREGMPDGVPFA